MRVATMVATMVAVMCMAAATAQAADPSAQVARGKYLVENVGMCGDCHTPRDAMGRPDGERRLQGASIDFRPTVPVPDWAEAAPPLAGGSASGWSHAQLVRFLETGLSPAGKPARPPMPPVRLSRQDAEAVAAYLESLPGAGATLNTKAKMRR